MLKRCTRVGVNVTKRCNWRCRTCFYINEPGYFTNDDTPLQDIFNQVEEAQRRGLDHAVIVGFGEPTLWPNLLKFVQHCKSIGMESSIITNGTANPKFYEQLYHDGLNHIHMSVHGIGDTLNRIAGSQVAGERQQATMTWLKESKLPWRSNTTLQLENFTELPKITSHILEHGANHVVLLGFLPHYGWYNRLREVAVHPENLKQYIEPSMDLVIKSGKYLTLRYHPMCHLRQDLWPYVTNANFVVFDAGEWEYGASGSLPDEQLKATGLQLGENVSIKGEPCASCALRKHCGGWNATYADGFDGANLKSIPREQCHEQADEFGFYWYQNPFNTQFVGHF